LKFNGIISWTNKTTLEAGSELPLRREAGEKGRGEVALILQMQSLNLSGYVLKTPLSCCFAPPSPRSGGEREINRLFVKAIIPNFTAF
jgi:hypothetical protein